MAEERIHYKLLFPSKYLKCADLRGRDVPVTIRRIIEKATIEGEKGRKETKPLAYFVETQAAAKREGTEEKALVLNVTKCNIIAELHGPYPVDWVGKRIILYPSKANYQGKEVDAIGIRPIIPPTTPTPTEQ